MTDINVVSSPHLILREIVANVPLCYNYVVQLQTMRFHFPTVDIPHCITTCCCVLF